MRKKEKQKGKEIKGKSIRSHPRSMGMIVIHLNQ